MKSNGNLMGGFIDYLVYEKRYSVNTVENYLRDVADYFSKSGLDVSGPGRRSFPNPPCAFVVRRSRDMQEDAVLFNG